MVGRVIFVVLLSLQASRASRFWGSLSAKYAYVRTRRKKKPRGHGPPMAWHPARGGKREKKTHRARNLIKKNARLRNRRIKAPESVLEHREDLCGATNSRPSLRLERASFYFLRIFSFFRHLSLRSSPHDLAITKAQFSICLFRSNVQFTTLSHLSAKHSCEPVLLAFWTACEWMLFRRPGRLKDSPWRCAKCTRLACGGR